MNDLPLEHAIDGFRLRIVVAASGTADSRFDTGFGAGRSGTLASGSLR